MCTQPRRSCCAQAGTGLRKHPRSHRHPWTAALSRRAPSRVRDAQLRDGRCPPRATLRLGSAGGDNYQSGEFPPGVRREPPSSAHLSKHLRLRLRFRVCPRPAAAPPPPPPPPRFPWRHGPPLPGEAGSPASGRDRSGAVAR